MRILYLTDIHGNLLLLRRALEIAEERKADLVVLGGDLCCRLDLHIVVSEGDAHVHFDEGLEDGEDIEDPQEVERSLWEQGIPCMVVDVNGLEGLQEELADPELGGEFYDGLQMQSLRLVVEAIKASPVPVVCIPGNDDPDGTDVMLKKLKVTSLHGRTKRVKGYTFAGFGGINFTPLRTTNLEFEEPELHERVVSVANKAKPPVVLVVHAPPLNTNLDEVPSGRHVGSSGVRDAVKEVKPVLSLHGHIHESVGMDRIGSTMCVNTGSFFEDDLLSAAVIELEGKGVSVKFLSEECERKK